MKAGNRVQWIEKFPDGFQSVRRGVVESYWGKEGEHHLYWVLRDNRNGSESVYEDALTLIEGGGVL